MKLKVTDSDASNFIVHDLDNDCKIQAVLSADDETGEYESYSVDPNILDFKRDENGSLIKETKTANIKLIDVRLLENSDLLDRIDPKNLIDIKTHRR